MPIPGRQLLNCGLKFNLTVIIPITREATSRDKGDSDILLTLHSHERPLRSIRLELQESNGRIERI